MAVVATGGLAAGFVLVAAADLDLAVVSPVAPRVVLALVSAEAGHFGPAHAAVAALRAQVPVVAAARALVPVAVLVARDDPDLVAAA